MLAGDGGGGMRPQAELAGDGGLARESYRWVPLVSYKNTALYIKIVNISKLTLSYYLYFTLLF